MANLQTHEELYNKLMKAISDIYGDYYDIDPEFRKWPPFDDLDLEEPVTVEDVVITQIDIAPGAE